jgi:hypothetical protein
LSAGSALVSLWTFRPLVALRTLLALRPAIVFDPLAVDVELAVAANDETVACQLVVRHFQRRAVPPQSASDRNLTPVHIESTAASGRQAVARQIGRIHLNGIATAQL